MWVGIVTRIPMHLSGICEDITGLLLRHYLRSPSAINIDSQIERAAMPSVLEFRSKAFGI